MVIFEEAILRGFGILRCKVYFGRNLSTSSFSRSLSGSSIVAMISLFDSVLEGLKKKDQF